MMKWLRRLPVYATGVGFGVLLLALAVAGDWSDLTLFLVGLAVAAFYTLTILAPWLVNDQLDRQQLTELHAKPQTLLYLYEVEVRDSVTGETIKPNGANGAPHAHVTHGRGVPTHQPTSVLTP